jgi:hypothetical protein
VSSIPPALNHTPCTIRRLCHSPPYARCEWCGLLARRVWEVSRTAIDVDLEHPVLLLVTVSVHAAPRVRVTSELNHRSCIRTPSTLIA